MEIGEKIRAIRESKGMTAREVVAKCQGMGAPSYSRIETGGSEPTIDSLRKIAAALEVKVGELMDEDFQPETLSSQDASLVAKVKMIESLDEEERKIVFSLVDAFAGKRKMKEELGKFLAGANRLLQG
jgi:transcriptional regulator with XRE-family HTH domain